MHLNSDPAVPVLRLRGYGSMVLAGRQGPPPQVLARHVRALHVPAERHALLVDGVKQRRQQQLQVGQERPAEPLARRKPFVARCWQLVPLA